MIIEVLARDFEIAEFQLSEVLEHAIGSGAVQDAVLAKSRSESRALWAIRDCTSEMPRTFGPQAPFDVAIPTGRIGDFVVALDDRLTARWPNCTRARFGHAADSNLHVAVCLDEHVGTEQEVEELVYSLVGEWGGAITGEHGVGTHKLAYLRHTRTPAEIAVMRIVKSALDPRGILNPGKVFTA